MLFFLQNHESWSVSQLLNPESTGHAFRRERRWNVAFALWGCGSRKAVILICESAFGKHQKSRFQLSVSQKWCLTIIVFKLHSSCSLIVSNISSKGLTEKSSSSGREASSEMLKICIASSLDDLLKTLFNSAPFLVLNVTSVQSTPVYSLYCMTGPLFSSFQNRK